MKRKPKAKPQKEAPKEKAWRVIMNGKLPPLITFATEEEAVTYVSNTTGETHAAIRQNMKADCPTSYRNTDFDIEEV